jgi:hypothetical protein
LLVLGGPEAEADRVGDLVSDLRRHRGSVVSEIHGLSTRGDGASVGRIDNSIATQLGLVGVTLLAVRPDRYVGFRDDAGSARALSAYLQALVA